MITRKIASSVSEERSLREDHKLQVREKLLVFGIILLLFVTGFLLYDQYFDPNKNKSTETENQQEVAKIKEDLEKLILLPNDSEPTIATITDISKLQADNPTFYKDAQNGDKLVLYPDKAIIYSVDKNKIVNIAPIISAPSSQTTSNLSQTDNVKINSPQTDNLEKSP